MSSISLFRQLPKHILESICKYAIPISEDNRGPRPGIAMLRTDLFDSFGPEWREVALEHYFKNFTLAFNSGLGKVNSTHPLDEGFISVEEELQAIKSVNIYVALDDLVSGKAAHMLAQSKYSSLVFSSVKTLKIDINEFHKSAWTFDADDATSTPSLYQQLLVMFPEVTRVLLSKGSRSAANIVATNCEFEQFVLALFNCFSGVCATLDFKGGIKCMWNIEDIHSVVTEMTLSEDCYSEKTFKLVHKCAATLKVLDMHVYTGLGVLNVFTDAKGKPVEYPRLTTLNLNKGYGPGNESYVTCPQVLLPNLTHLTIEGGYPFDNAVLFRSTSKTLKYVGVRLDVHLFSVLADNHVFLGPEYSNLCHVKIFFNSEARGFVMDRPEEYWPYVFSISHNLRGLTMPSTFTYHDTLKKLLEGPAMENLKYLKLEGERVGFKKLCSLVEKMPQLVHLSVSQLLLDYDTSKMSRAQIYDKVTSKRPILSHRLKYCDVVGEFRVNDLATCGMLLAVICPSVTRFMANSRSSKPVQEEIDQAIKEEPFSQYSDKLKCLTYNGIPEGSETFAAKQVYW
ncbi:hypothetical protein GGI03_000230 [Coemansia sp. RSA 2337]|nr:hypothetical protein H4S03_000239 [Coemansia sp. S3946]KAJ2068149.1 hypothetical protein GGI08_001025 [Coemansia sp. S2]KAJ2469631.1 hypothetical protein GGI03_000230 [Coemansia sp. RSA 2337]